MCRITLYYAFKTTTTRSSKKKKKTVKFILLRLVANHCVDGRTVKLYPSIPANTRIHG